MQSAMILILAFITSLFSTIAYAVYYITIAITVENYLLKKDVRKLSQKVYSRLFPFILLTIRFLVHFYLRVLLLIIPGVIYAVSNIHFGLAFILRDQQGKSAFKYSRKIVEGNWWRVFFIFFLFFSLNIGCYFIFKKLLGFIIHKSLLLEILSSGLSSLVGILPSIGMILLFFNLDFLKSLESIENHHNKKR
jgi:hypothetical protein